MSAPAKIATVFGGTGFVGRQVVRGLARKGYTVKVASRVPESAFFLRTAGFVGQIVPFACDYKNPASIAQAVRGRRLSSTVSGFCTSAARAISNACRQNCRARSRRRAPMKM
jgi:uncharacterized protein YbjT (DUF2867 family)